MIENQEHTQVEVGSNRSFGIVFFVVFALIGLFPLIGDGDVRLWSLVIAALFLAISLIVPQWLQPLNLLWFKLGMFLAKIVNPIVMFIIYVGAFLPTGLVLRLAGKDLLRRRFDSAAPSYWIERTPAGPEPESLSDQF